MPATFTRVPAEVDKKQPGQGGRPPVDRKPTGGGGDGDEWRNQPPGRRGPRELLRSFRAGLFFALAGDLMFFIAIATAFIVRQNSGHWDARLNWTTDWRAISLPPILWLNTVVLVVSSVTIELSRRHLFREPDVMEEWLGLGRPASRKAFPCLLMTAILGAVFLAGQWIAWKQLASQLTYIAENPSRDFFYLITGLHALHLVLGAAALVAALAGLRYLQRFEIRQILVDCVSWYWHTMGVLWIFLFALLVFFQ